MLECVLAGLKPIISYNPAANDFLELSGPGMALGVDKHFQCMGAERRWISMGFSRSKIEDGSCIAIKSAVVVLPHCRGPSRAVTGCI